MLIPRLYFLQENEQLLIESPTQRRVLNGPGQYLSRFLERVTVRKALILNPGQYVRLKNTLTGALTNVLGPRLYFLAANETVEQELTAFPLRDNQYVRLRDNESGRVRIVRGEAMVYLEPNEELFGQVETGINVDERSGVLVRDITNGQRSLITGTQIFIPTVNQDVIEVRKGHNLDERSGVLVRDTNSGQLTLVRGPQIFIPSPTQEVVEVRKGINVDEKQAVLVRDTRNGQLTLIRETQIFIPDANQEVVEVRTATTLDEQTGLLVRDITDGTLALVRGPAVFIPAANQEIVEGRNAVHIDEKRAVLVRDTRSGALTLIREKQIFIPDAQQQVVEVREAILIDEQTAVLVRDLASGEETLIREKQLFIPAANQEVVAVRKGVNIDEETAVLVRNITDGQLRLITAAQVFIPDATQEIVEVRKLIRLEDHQTVIIKDREGRYVFRRGSDAQRSFFLEPYHELLKLWWSSGLHKDSRNLGITHIDNRPKYMWYEFDVRTQDNVELVIGITFFWQIVNVEAMIKMTDDATGDVSSHARSTIIQAVSRVTLERFLADFNNIVRHAVIGNPDDLFYAERGVTIHAVEVRSVACKDPETQNILMEIIQETTNRLNRLQKQESENEVKLKALQGDIETEIASSQLLATRREHARTVALTQGEAEANRVRVFLEGMGEMLSVEQKVAIFNTLRKQEMLSALAEGNASLYFTPSDVDLSIKG
jgi:hypothetical protein